MSDLSGKRVAVLATHGFEQSELTVPLQRLRDAGAHVAVVSPETNAIRGWEGDDWGETVPVDMALADADAAIFEALVLPGGQINPDVLRTHDSAVNLIRAFHDAGKPVAAICHAPWLLIEAGVAKGRRMTSYSSIRTDVENAGAIWLDEAVVVDQGLITSRDPGDLVAFCDAVVEALQEGGRQRRDAA